MKVIPHNDQAVCVPVSGGVTTETICGFVAPKHDVEVFVITAVGETFGSDFWIGDMVVLSATGDKIKTGDDEYAYLVKRDAIAAKVLI